MLNSWDPPVAPALMPTHRRAHFPDDGVRAGSEATGLAASGPAVTRHSPLKQAADFVSTHARRELPSRMFDPAPRLADPAPASPNRRPGPGQLDLRPGSADHAAVRRARTPPSRPPAATLPEPTSYQGTPTHVREPAVRESVDNTRGRLQEISDRFSGFERQVELDTRSRKEAEHASMEDIHSRCARLTQLVREETQKGEEHQSQLRAMLEVRVAEAQSKLEVLFLERFDHAHAMVDAMSDRMQEVETTYSQASEIFVRDMTEESGAIHKDYWDFRLAFQEEITRHQESGRVVSARIAELERSATQRATHEQQFSEQKWCQLAREVQEETRMGQGYDQNFQEQMMARLEAVRAGLLVASKDREQADDDIVAALNHYTQALQGTISSVSRNALLSAGL